MTGKTFYLDTFDQDHDEFDIGNGKTIQFRNRSDFTSVEQAKMMAIGQDLERLTKRIEKNPNDARASDRLMTIQEKFLMLILPDIPDAVMETLNAGKIGLITQFWTDNQNSRFENGSGPGED